jgi:hypothetical protein
MPAHPSLELLLYRLTRRQYHDGMQVLECSSCSLLLQWLTLDPSPSSLCPRFHPRWKHLMILKMVIICIIHIIAIMCIMAIMCINAHIIAIISIISDCFQVLVGWLESVGSRVVYELAYKKPILYVIPIQSILGKLPLVPVGDTSTIRTACATPFRALPATGGRVQAMDGIGRRMWFVNSWALGWSRDLE